MRPSLVIFDCDGVLVDSEPPSNQVMQQSLSKYGLDMSLEECMNAFVGSTMKNAMATAISLGADLPDNWIAEVYDETYATLRNGVPLVDSIAQLLGTLKAADIPFCVASNGSEDKMKITLGQNGLWDTFSDRMFSAHTLGVAKPDPDLFLHAAAHFQCSPNDCVVVEDSGSGVTAAIRANMRCLAYAPHSDGKNLRDLGAEVFKNMAAVPDLLGL
ncbi:HAD family hydrolase [Cochlodiniinecator piscidefendens]|uniref:HAD family hydrolase n=1 Tax=Cochlodiniinecator piscidefendens TaxID=2715756 RepID=UPI0014076B77|nr:HAD family phosphatase [Cochlodiniinecator piscidefendens]